MTADTIRVVETETVVDDEPRDVTVHGGALPEAVPPVPVAAPAGDSSTEAEPIEALLRLAIERGTPVEVLERLLAIRERLQAQAARRLYDQAICAFQARLGPISRRIPVKNRDGSIRYHYAPMEDIVATVRDPLAAAGLSYRIPGTIEERVYVARCEIRHVGGHVEVVEFRCPIEQSLGMTLQQAVASAQTFAGRRAFCAALGITTAESDQDGNDTDPASPQPTAATQPKPAPKQEARQMPQEVADCFRAAHERLKAAVADGAISEETAKSWFADLKISAHKTPAEALAELSGARTRLDRLVAEHVAKKGELPL